MKTGSLVVGLTVAFAHHAPAQESDKVEQYRGMLLKRPENAVLFGRLVDAWLEKGEMAGLKDYLEAKAKEGGAVDWRLLAVFRSYSGDEAGAITALDEALKQAPEDARTRLSRAKALGAAARFDEALADLEAAAKTAEVALEAGTLRGKYLARAGRPQEAVKAWKEIISANPADDGLREDLIELEIGEGLMDEAVVSARELAEKTADPYQKALRRLRVAEILAQAGKKGEAVDEYTQVFGVSAEASWLEHEVLARVGALFTREDDMGGLREFHQKLRDAWPRRVAVKKEAARSLMATGDGDEAVAMFREVIKVMPGDRGVREEFIALLEGAGRIKDAAEEISALLAANDKDAALWEKMAAARMALGDEAGLKTALDRAVELAPQDENGRIAAAALLERHGRKDDAERVLREAVSAHGSAGDAGDSLATLLASHGKKDDAVNLWQEMGKTADREGLLRITRSLTANGQAALAFEILTARLGDFKDDPLLIAALCQSAQFSDKSESAIPQAFELVRQAKTSGDLENALRQAVSLVFRAKEPRKWIEELAAKGNAGTQELCLLSELQEGLGDSIESERLLKKAMEGGDPLLAAAQRVRLFEARGDLEAAVAATRDWIAMPGGMKTEQIKRIVGLYERMDNLDEALKEIDNWKRIAPGDKIAWTTRADLLSRSGRPEEAVAELRRALAKFGADEEMRSNLASTLTEAGLTEEAARMYATLHDEAESPASKVKWAGTMADLAAVEGKEDELVNDFKRRARENPSSVAPLLALAEIYRAWQRQDEELEAIAEASRRKPEDVSLIQRLADLEERGGSVDKAEALLRSAIRVQDTPENRRRLSAFWIRNGDPDRGLNELLAEKSASGPRDIERIIEPLMISSDHASALRILAAEAPRHPDDWRLGYLHALALKESGEKDAAFKRFADLLGAKNEIQGLKSVLQANQSYYFGYQGRQRTELSGFAKFLQFQTMTSSSSNRLRAMYFGMNGQQLAMPGTLEELRWMAACQAMDIAKEDPATREVRLSSLRTDGLQDLEAIKLGYWMDPDELAKRVNDDQSDPRLFRWFVESANNRFSDPYGRRRIDPKTFLKGAERCAATDPELALKAMLRVEIGGENGMGATGAAKMFELISALPADKKPDYCSALQKLVSSNEKVVEKELREKALALLLEQLKVLREKNGGTWIEDSLAMQWMVEGRFEEAVEMLNSGYRYRVDPERKRQANHARTGAGMPYYSGRMYFQQSENQLKFPEVLSSSVSNQILSSFRFGNRGGSYSISDDQKKILKLLGEKEDAPNGRAEPIDLAGLARVVSKVEDPFQRVFFAQAVKKPDLVAGAIETLGKELPDDPAALTCMAAYQQDVVKDVPKAYSLLVKAGALAKDAGQRSMLDWQIYQTGLKLAENKDVDLDAARRAVLRLRKTMGTDDDSKRVLADGMKKLGLEEESRRFVAAPVRARAGGPRYAGGMRGPGMSRSNRSQLATLVAQGKRETAARQALREVASFRVSQNQWTGGFNYQETQLYESIVSLKLEDEIVKVGIPGEGAGYKSRRDFALLLVRIGKLEAALPMLRKLAEERMDDFEVRAALLIAMPKEEQRNYVLMLPEAKFDSDKIGTWFTGTLERGGNRKFAEFLANVEMFVMFIEKLPVSFEADRNLTWVNYLAKDLFQNYYFEDDVRLKPMRSENGGGSDQVNEARTKERDDMARRLYRAMLKHPQTCQQGFILMEYHRASLGFTDDDLAKAAGDAVGLSFRLKVDDDEELARYGSSGGSRRNLWIWTTTGGGGSSRGSIAGGIDPMSYLLSNAANGTGVNPLSPEALARISESDPKQAKIIEACLKVVDSGGLQAFEEWKRKLKDSAEDHGESLHWLTRLAYFRKRPDILDASLDLTCELALADKSNYQGQARFGECLAMSVNRARGIQEKTKVLERIARKLLGPPEAWKLYGERNGVVSGSIQARMALFQQLVEPFQSSREDLVAISRFAAENQMWISGYVSFNGYSHHWRRQKDNAATVKDWCSTGIFAAGPAPACSNRADSDGGLLVEAMEGFVSNYSRGSDDTKKIGAEFLKVEGTDRFWARLLGARLIDDPKPAVAELNAASKEIAKWPPHARLGLVHLIGAWFPNSRDSLDGSLKRMLADSEKSGDKEMREKAEQFLKEGFDQNVQPYSVERGELGKVLNSLVADDPALAAKLWIKALEHFERLRGGGSSSSNGFSKTMGQYANVQLFQAFSAGNISLSDVAEFVRMMEKEKQGAISGMFDSEQSYYSNPFVERWLAARRNEFAKSKSLASLKEDLRPLAGSLLSIHTETPKESAAIAAALYVAYSASEYSNWSSQIGGPELRDWLRKSLAREDAALANAALAATYSRMQDKQVTDADKADYRRIVVGLMKDVSVPADLRLLCLSLLTSRAGPRAWLDDASSVPVMADVLIASTVPGTNWASSTSFAVIEMLAKTKSIQPGDAARVLAAIEAAPVSFAAGGGYGAVAETRLNRMKLTLAVKAGAADQVPRLVKQAGALVRGDLSLARSLWQGGAPASAVTLLPRPGEYHRESRVRYFNTRESGSSKQLFDRELENGLPSWLPSIDDPGQRFRVECLFSCLEDAKGDAAPSKPRKERVAALVARFPNEAPKARVSREEILAALAMETSEVKPLADEYIEGAERNRLGQLIPLRDGDSGDAEVADSTYVTEMIIRRGMRFEIEVKGNTANVLKQLESLVGTAGGNQEYRANEMLRDVGRWYPLFLMARMMEMPLENRAGLAAQALRISELLLIRENADLQRIAVALAITSQAAAGNGALLDAWLGNLGEPAKSRYIANREKRGLPEVIGVLGADPFSRKEYAAIRKELILALLKDRPTVDREFKSQPDFTLNHANGLISDDDMLELIDKVAQNHPKQVQLWVEKGGITAWGKDNNQEAEKAYLAAEAAAGEDAALLSYAKAHHIVFLNGRMKDANRARELAKSVDPKLLPKYEREVVEKALKEPEPEKKQ